MLSRSLGIFLFLSFAMNSFGQSAQTGYLLNDLEPEVWNDPRVVLDVIDAYLVESPDPLTQLKQRSITARTNYATGRYDKTLDDCFKAFELFPQKDIVGSPEALDFYALLRLTLTNINLQEASDFIPERFKASNASQPEGSMLLMDALALAEQGDTANAIASLTQAFPTAESEFVWNDRLGISPSLLLLAWKKDKQIPDVLITWLEDGAVDSDNLPLTTTAKVSAEQLLAKLHFINRDHNAAIVALENCLRGADKLNNHSWLAELYRQLAENHLALNEGAKYQQAINQAVDYSQKEERIRNESINVTQAGLGKLQTYNSQLLAFEAKHKQKQANLFIIAIAILAFITTITYAVRISRTRELIQFARVNLQFAQGNDQPSIAAEGVAINQSSASDPKPSNIPAETEQLLLTKLKHFEAGKRFLNSDMSLAQLSTLLETNSKYVSEIINRHKGKNFNAYINELRIKYIVEKLQNNPTYLNYKVSYLAEESGFSSHSSFTTVFKGVVGMSPARFIEMVVKEKDAA